LFEDAWTIRKVLSHISDDHCRILGLNPETTRPEWMMATVWPVPPPQIRPMHTTPAHNRGDDDVTVKLKQIVQTNRLLRECSGPNAPSNRKLTPATARKLWQVVQWHINTLVDNNRASEYAPATHRKNNKPLKTLRERLRGKGGRMREDVQGKRVDGAGRTVLVPGIDISFTEVGIPEIEAMDLCKTETVTPLNRDRLEQLVRNGPKQWPGANYIVVIDAETRTVRKEICLERHRARHEIRLEDGWKVKRHLQDGDCVIVNRQPSLHRESTMKHRVRVLHGEKTRRISPLAMGPYNADCDGDEMTVHVPQTEEEEQEAIQIMAVERHIRSPGNRAPCMGPIQDVITALFRMTRKDRLVERKQAMRLLWAAKVHRLPEPAVHVRGKPYWTGKQLFSCVIPPGVRVWRRVLHADKDGVVDDNKSLIVLRGELLVGRADKRAIGATSDSIVDLVALDRTDGETALMFDRCVAMSRQFSSDHGFSVHLGDLVIPKGEHRAKIVDIMKRAHDASEQMVANNESEGMINEMLNKAIMYAGGVARQAAPTDQNNMVAMIDGGGKGKPVNLFQTAAAVGQQNVDGGRPKPEPTSDRCLPYFSPGDRRMEARGFVPVSYTSGLGPVEFFFHCMGGREGLVDTAVRTSDTGYISRRLVKFSESQRVHHGDASVRDAWGLVESRYGEDGLDAQRMCWVRLEGLEGPEGAFVDKYLSLCDAPEEARRMLELRRIAIDAMVIHTSISNDRVPGPMNTQRLIQDAQSNCVQGSKGAKGAKGVGTSLTMQEAALMVQSCFDALEPTPAPFTHYMMRAPLCSKRVVLHHRLSRSELAEVLTEVTRAWNRAHVHAGENVGVLASTAVSEPSMQLTLNTFHLSGLKEGRKMTLGVPRYKEIIGLASTLGTPLITVRLLAPWACTRAGAEVVRRALQGLALKELVCGKCILAEKEAGEEEALEEARASFLLLPDCPFPDIDDWSNVACVIHLDAEKMRIAGVDLDTVCQLARDAVEASGAAIIIPVGHATESPQLHLWPVRTAADDTLFADPRLAMALADRICENVFVTGIPGVTVATVRHVTTRIHLPNDGGLSERDEYIIETDGTDNVFETILGIEGVDTTRTICNDPKVMLAAFGIEMAWRVITNEVREIFDAASVDFRHISLIAKTMCRTGDLSAVSRFGIRNWNNAPLLLASFEETVDVIFGAATFGTLDELRGVAERIITGTLTDCGTGSVKVKTLPEEETMGIDTFPQASLPQAIEVAERAETAASVAKTRARRERRDRRLLRMQPLILGSSSFTGAAGGGGGGLLGLGAGDDEAKTEKTVICASVPMQSFCPPSPQWIRTHNNRMPPPSPRWMRRFEPPSPRWIQVAPPPPPPPQSSF
jgi:DNA-directed RNA polymerase II subunit RPB1